jgi:hypothetical protein
VQVRCGSKPVKLGLSKCFPVRPRKRTFLGAPIGFGRAHLRLRSNAGPRKMIRLRNAPFDSTSPMARSPHRKAAVAYLAASGAVPITVIDRDGVGVVIVGRTSDTVAGRWWIHAHAAARVAAQARRFAGIAPDVASAIAAVQRSAALLGAILTADDVAISRAGAAMQRLDAMIETMRADGTLRQFNVRYKAGRAEAAAEGRGFISYGAAMQRLKLALIPGLQSGKPIAGLFAEVFR